MEGGKPVLAITIPNKKNKTKKVVVPKPKPKVRKSKPKPVRIGVNYDDRTEAGYRNAIAKAYQNPAFPLRPSYYNRDEINYGRAVCRSYIGFDVQPGYTLTLTDGCHTTTDAVPGALSVPLALLARNAKSTFTGGSYASRLAGESWDDIGTVPAAPDPRAASDSSPPKLSYSNWVPVYWTVSPYDIIPPGVNAADSGNQGRRTYIPMPGLVAVRLVRSDLRHNYPIVRCINGHTSACAARGVHGGGGGQLESNNSGLLQNLPWRHVPENSVRHPYTSGGSSSFSEFASQYPAEIAENHIMHLPMMADIDGCLEYTAPHSSIDPVSPDLLSPDAAAKKLATMIIENNTPSHVSVIVEVIRPFAVCCTPAYAMSHRSPGETPTRVPPGTYLLDASGHGDTIQRAKQHLDTRSGTPHKAHSQGGLLSTVVGVEKGIEKLIKPLTQMAGDIGSIPFKAAKA